MLNRTIAILKLKKYLENKGEIYMSTFEKIDEKGGNEEEYIMYIGYSVTCND